MASQGEKSAHVDGSRGEKIKKSLFLCPVNVKSVSNSDSHFFFFPALVRVLFYSFIFFNSFHFRV